MALLTALAPLLMGAVLADAGDLLSPLLAPYMDDVCKKVECGKGSCKPSTNSSLLFACECDPGWRQAASQLDDHFNFLPCVVPNCTIDYSCSEAHSRVQNEVTSSNFSIFDPCHWAYCGDGSCNKTAEFSHTCECKEGYNNLLNMTSFPCFRECMIGMDCSNLGLTVTNQSTSSTPTVSDSGSQANSALPFGFSWVTILLISVAVIQSEYITIVA